MTQKFIFRDAIRLDHLFQLYRNQPALITSSSSQAFGNIEEKVADVCVNLIKSGVGKGQRIALHGVNSELHLYLFLAAWLLDFLYLPLDYKAPLTGLFKKTKISLLITDEKRSVDYDGKVVPAAQILNPQNVMPTNRKWNAVPFSREASAIFTSGSTGAPKGIVHTVGNYIYSALGTNEFLGLTSSDRWLLSLPLFHVGGALIWVRTLLSGSACILPDPEQNLTHSIQQFQPTVISVVPAQLIRLLEQKEALSCLQRIKTIMLGGAPTPEWLIVKSLDLGLPIMPTYGCTESCAQATGVAQGSPRQDYFSAGQAAPHRKIRIQQDGRIVLGGKTLFKRYLSEPQNLSPDPDRFFVTADAGSFDARGNLVIQGRTDNIFISGGENISPLEIENSLLRQEGILTAIVVPAPHREYGLTPWAFVETSGIFDEKNILDRLRKDLPGYKLPKKIIRLEPCLLEGKMKFSRNSLTRLARTLSEGSTPP